MLGGIRTDLLVTLTLLFLIQRATQCRAENDFSLVTLPDWRMNAEYVTQCYYDQYKNLICDWTRKQQTSATAPADVTVNILESGPLGLEGEACLEFWYLAPVAANGSELRALLKNSIGLVEIWTSPALPRDSWRQVFVPLNVIKAGSQVVFEAVQAVSVERQVALDRIGVRRGSCGDQCESHTEFWTDESTHCLCSVGQLSCSPAQCPLGRVCGPQQQGSNGISANGTCTIHSNADFSTFDGVLLRFMAPCNYILAKTCLPTETLPVFSVEVVNEQNRNSSRPTVQQVVMKMGNFRVSLLRRQTHRVVVNGVWKKLPLTLSSGAITIKSNPTAVTLRTRFGLSISYDIGGAVHVNLPSTYFDYVCGLCGNFNHLSDDDFRMPNGTTAQDATALTESWQTEKTNPSCETILVPHQCDSAEEAEYASELYCGGLLSTTGPFAACLPLLGAESYFRGCVVDLCSTHGDPAVLCDTLQAYADICQKAGVAIPLWRNSTFCPLQCGENSHYNSCADGCPEVCSSLDIASSCGSCEERCECDSGFKFSRGKCVPAEHCGCWYNGKHYERGETLLEGECVKHCQCMGNNEVQCITMQCADNEICKDKDGVKGCFPFSPATCSVYGDPHFITFDGMAYDFQGGCRYTLATTCGGESLVHFTVIGHNMHPRLQNFTRSKLEAVALQVEGLYLILNQSGKVYVNNVDVQLPWSTNGTYGSVWVHMKNNYIVLETTFGLRMMIDGQYRLFLQVDERYKYELCGLCGTYSEQQDDDFITPEGQTVSGPFEFGDSWRVQGDNECIAHPNDPRVCDYDEENDAYNECYTLLRDAFEPCHALVHPSIYLSSCVYDYCATSGDQHTLCESLKSYAVACEVAGVELPHWQTSTACVCPMNCNFEKNLCGWEQLIQDSFDWTRHSGPTPSIQTGPNEDHTTGAGFYMYIEGNSASHGDSARLLSTMCHYNGPICLHFWYHMYGSAEAMALNIYLLKDNKATKIWSMRNNQGQKWHPVYVDIKVSGPFQIIVEGIRGSDAQSDVALDDISINFSSCSGSFPGLVSGTVLPSTTTEILPLNPGCSIDCSFHSNLCSWNQMMTDAFDRTWQSGSTPTLMTGPSADHTGDGHYLYIEASSVTHGDTARLISSECSDSGPQCLQFWYHMHGSADTMGLSVYLRQDRKADAVWWKKNDQGNMWHLAQVDLATNGTFQIIFEGRRGSNDESDVAIDDVSLHHGHCTDLLKPTSAPTTPEQPERPTTARPQPPTTAGSQPPITVGPQPQTTGILQPPTATNSKTTARPQPPTTDGPQPPTTVKPQLPTTAQPEPPTTTELQPPAETLAQTTVKPEWPTTAGPQPPTTTGPQPTTTGTLQPPISTHTKTTAQPQPPTTDGLQPPTTAKPQPLTTAQPEPPTTTELQPPAETLAQTTVKPEWPTTARPQIPTTVGPQTPTTAGPQPTTTVGPKPTTTGTQQPPIETLPQTTVKPEWPTTARPQPPTTAAPQPPITAGPQPPTTTGPQPTTTGTLQPPISTHTKTTSQPQPPTTDGLQPPTTAKPQPLTTAQPEPPTTAELQPPTETLPQTTLKPERPTTAGPQIPTTVGPQTPSTAGPQPPTTAGPQPPTTAAPQPPITAGPQPPTTAGPQPTTTAGPQPTTTGTQQPPIETLPQTTVKPEWPTTARPQPPNTVGPQTPSTAGPQPTSTAGPQPTSTAGPQPPTEILPQPQTTDKPQHPATTTLKPLTTVKPQPPATTTLQAPTTAIPQTPATATPHPTTITSVPTPSCPQNSHYTTCIPACSPTCTHLNGLLHCSDQEGCVQGCLCNDGFVQKRKVCVPIQQCGCVEQNGARHQFNEVWYINHCSQKCECKKDDGMGKIECHKDECDGNAVCLQTSEFNYYCQPTDFKECAIRRGTEYRTFDKKYYDFEGEHSYVLVQTKNIQIFPDVYIEGSANTVDENDDNDSGSEEDCSHRFRDEDDDEHDDENDEDDDKHDDDSEEHEEHHGLQALKIKVYNHTVEFKKKLRLVVDGRRTCAPVSPTGGLKIYVQSSRIYLMTDFGLLVEFDGESTAEFILPNIYARKVGGLCGNLDGWKRNDWMKPDGTRAGSVDEFGESWKV